ncbi:MAG: Gfo/Idh/MocA family oxidoreductase [Chitinophagaceae bacterium]
MSNQSTRRNFIRKMATGVAGMALTPEVIGAAGGNNRIEELSRNNKYGPADTIRLALIGAGGMGLADANTAITVPGVKLVAVCDLYDGRLADARKIYGNDIFTTRDYKEILQRKDIDAVIVATPDHWHKDISIECHECR